MDWLSFISKLIETVVWPIVVLTIIFLFKNDISKVFGNIKALKYKDTVLDFGSKIEEAKSEADEIFPENKTYRRNENNERLKMAAKESPRGMVIDSWLRVENALVEYSRRYNVDVDENKPFRLQDLIWFNGLDDKGLGKGLIGMLEKLRKIRNEAVHLSEANIDSNSAIEYASLAERVIRKLEEA